MLTRGKHLASLTATGNSTRRRSSRTAKIRLDYRAMHEEGITRNMKAVAAKTESRATATPTLGAPAPPLPTTKAKSTNSHCGAIAAFFQPGYIPPKEKQPKKQRKKRVFLTDKERRKWARDHWFQHHGHETSTIHAVAPAKTPIKPTRYVLPSWSVAKATVFDSSTDEESISRTIPASNAVQNGNRNSAGASTDSSDDWATPAPRPDLSSSSDNWATSAYSVCSEQ